MKKLKRLFVLLLFMAAIPMLMGAAEPFKVTTVEWPLDGVSDQWLIGYTPNNNGSYKEYVTVFTNSYTFPCPLWTGSRISVKQIITYSGNSSDWSEEAIVEGEVFRLKTKIADWIKQRIGNTKNLFCNTWQSVIKKSC